MNTGFFITEGKGGLLDVRPGRQTTGLLLWAMARVYPAHGIVCGIVAA